MKKYRLFVYGTLRKGQGLHDSMVGEYITSTSTYEAEFTMYDLGAYPAVIPRGNRRIWGEVYEVTAKQLEDVDLIEGVPDLYVRSRVKLTNGDLAFSYLLAPAVAEHIKEYKEVLSSDWVVYKSTQNLNKTIFL